MSRPRASARKILFYSVATHLGGAERSLLDLVTRLEEASGGRYSPWPLLPRGEGALVEGLREAGVSFGVERMPEGLLSLGRAEAGRAPARHLARGIAMAPGVILYLKNVNKIIRRERAALVHTTGIKCHALGALAARRSGAQVLWHLRDILEPGPVYWGLRALERVGRVHLAANSAATAAAFLPGSAGSGRVGVVHNGLDPREWGPRAAASAESADSADFGDAGHERLRQALGVRPGELLVGIVGVLARWKGQREFLRMARRIVDQGFPARFAIIGGEIYDTAGERGFGLELREEARRLGLSERVAFTGHVRDPAGHLGALDIVVHASTRPEPFGRVLIEAMALGRPLVAARAGGVLEIVEEERTALLHEPGDVDGMARAVARLLADPRLREELARGASREFRSRFTVDRYVKGVVALYDRIFSS